MGQPVEPVQLSDEQLDDVVGGEGDPLLYELLAAASKL